MADMPNLVGGALCLDFVNTVDPRHAADRREYLDSYPALAAWSRHAAAAGTDRDDGPGVAAAGGLAGVGEITEANEIAGANERAGSSERAGIDTPTGTSNLPEAEWVLRRAIRLREALYPLFRGAAQGQPPDPDDLGVLQAELTRALPHLRIGWSPAGFAREWEHGSPALDQVLWPVSWSAAELLTHGPIDRIRECPGQGNCGWLFLDLTKNASRRWCDMRVCGNRAKARRHYARAQAGGTD
jgi:predicted RNA-binding Zn ribbon-like protein